MGALPAWLSERDLDVYAGEFERTGMSGAGLVSSHLLDGCGHRIQQERPDEVNRL